MNISRVTAIRFIQSLKKVETIEKKIEMAELL